MNGEKSVLYSKTIVQMAQWIHERTAASESDVPLVAGLDLESLDRDLLAVVYGDAASVPDYPDSFVYPCMPIEFIPFGWQGGDALQYGFLVHAPELARDDWPVGSYAPGEDAVVWLGNNTHDAIQNLISAELRTAYEDPDWSGPPESFLENDHLLAFCKEFDLVLEPAQGQVITRGGRSERRIVPDVPSGWHHEATPNGVGVMAPRERFDHTCAPLRYQHHKDIKPFIQKARKYLSEGFAASALQQLYEVHADASLEGDRDVFGLMQDAYSALDRPALRERVDRYLRTFSSFK